MSDSELQKGINSPKKVDIYNTAWPEKSKNIACLTSFAAVEHHNEQH
jgi:hypothetical protein